MSKEESKRMDRINSRMSVHDMGAQDAQGYAMNANHMWPAHCLACRAAAVLGGGHQCFQKRHVEGFVPITLPHEPTHRPSEMEVTTVRKQIREMARGESVQNVVYDGAVV